MSQPRAALMTILTASLAGMLAVAAGPQPEIPTSSLMPPSQLNSKMGEVQSGKLVLIHVGFRVMYEMAHIPGSTYAGSASTPEGVAELREFAAKLPHDQQIVIYCGCCPWSHCPNIRPAFETLKQMGFSNLKALDIPERFGDDWTAKGYPTEKGESRN
jgi:thiosulfate/3-mercaptopyruvate sulfurtransferase